MSESMPAPYFRLSNFYFWYFAFLGAFAPYFALYLQSLGFTASQIGILLAVNPVTRIFGPTLWGWLSDHLGTRGKLIRWTALATALVFTTIFLTTHFGWLFAALVVLNVFWSGVLPLAESATLHQLEANFGAYGKIRLWGSVSFVLVVILGGYLLDNQGVSALAPLAVSMMVFMALSTLFLPPDREITHRGEHAPILSIALRPEVIALLGSFFLMQIAHGPFNAFYSIHLAEAGYSKKAIGWLWSVGVIAEIALFFWLPSLMRRFSLGQILRMSFGCAFLRFLVVAWGVESVGLMVAAQLLHAVTFGAYHAAGVAAVHQIFRGRHQARGQALYTSLGYGLGGTLGTLLSGFVWESWGAQATFSMGAIAALLALVVSGRRARN
jgi:MFS transporter, PPP family, 3-phenylpropionic acid transporter